MAEDFAATATTSATSATFATTYLEKDPPSALLLATLLRMTSSFFSILHVSIFLFLLLLLFLYNLLDFHLLRDLLRGCRGDRVGLTAHPSSHIYRDVASKCKTLQGRYLPTLWLSSPHLQTALIGFFGNPPAFHYTRQIFHLADGGTIALDWLLSSDFVGSSSSVDKGISKDDTTPILVVVPGLTSDSSSSYVKQLVHRIAKQGWNTVVVNHRGLGGISLTSDCFYNAGWTEDIRFVINHLHRAYPEPPLFLVGTSLGANIVVKYLGEEGEKTPIAGAASICSPWDLVICDRFINRKLVQKFYNRVLAVGLKGYAQLHQHVLSRMANWEGIAKSQSVREFDNFATRILANYETVDAYYRRCSSVGFIGDVSVPLLCINALDDPVCTKEAIPWDECRAKKNIVLVTTTHGGHLAFFQGLKAKNLWWVSAVDEFFNILHSSPHMHRMKKNSTTSRHHSFLESSIDKAPYINVMEGGMLTAVGNEGENVDHQGSSPIGQASEHQTMDNSLDKSNEDVHQMNGISQEPAGSSSKEVPGHQGSITIINELVSPVKKTLAKISKRSSVSFWLLIYIAITTSWPLIGSMVLIVFKRRWKSAFPKVRNG